MAKKFLSPLSNFWKKLGPGFITGSSDDDPSGVGTYASNGAQFGFSQLWLAWFCIPLMIAVQEMSARIGMVSGQGLVGAVKHRVPRWLLLLSVSLLLVANSVNIGSDIGAMADAAQLLVPQIPFVVFTLLITALTLVLEVFVSYKVYVKYLKWLTLSLLSYIVVALFIHLNWGVVLHEFIIPTMAVTREGMLMIVAILGTTISPYLMFWQASEEVEEKIVHQTTTFSVKPRDLKDMRFDVSFGMIFSQIIMFFIIAATAGVLFGSGVEINTGADAARVLEPLAGSQAKLLFALGMIGTGLLAIPVLAGSASYAIAELFGWRSGLYRKWDQAHGFYGVITIATLVGLLVNFVGISPIKALVWTAVINGVVAPFSIVLLLIAGNDKKIMGDYVNGRWSNLGGVAALVVMVGAIALYFFL